ncbi:MAG: L,D-transpeptidase [Deltaproteobacteria bacterium]|nr:L,D-transpeptidase [Deltaproteobacteria bacterium]
MRNLVNCCVLGLLALTLAGCGAGRVKLADQTVKQPLPILPAEPAYLTAEQQLVKQALDQNGYGHRGPKPTVIVIHKKTRKLTVYRGLTPLKTYPVVLGRNPRADKLRQGDLCTPEGVYRVVTKFEHPRWSKFILLDYPNTQNWLKFSRAKRRGLIPYDADIGGQIGIHGTDDPLKNLSGENWTWGCISMFNHHIEEIFPLVNEKTLIVITKN